jgi:AraC-like DNA-binding protein
MFNYEIIPYLASVSICLVLGIVLLTVRRRVATEDKAYLLIKRLLAFSAFADMFTNVAILYCLYLGSNYFVLDKVFTPFVYYLEYTMMMFAMLALIRASFRKSRIFLYYLIPPLVFLVVVLVTYFVTLQGKAFTYDSYAHFNTLKASDVFFYIERVAVVCLVTMSIPRLLMEEHFYKKKLTNNFSEKNVVKGRKLSSLIKIFIAYFLLAAVDAFINSNVKFDYAMVALGTLLFTYATIFILNLEEEFHVVASIANDDYTQSRHSQGKVPDTMSAMGIYLPTEMNIGTVVCEWEKRADKPYLRDNITLADVSEEMNLSPRLLSEYLNKVHKLNFSAWINSLRILEVNRLLQEQPQMKISDIALATGFSDQAVLGKAYRRITGVTPSTYRKSLGL